MVSLKKTVALVIVATMVAFLAGWKLAPVVQADSGSFQATFPLLQQIFQTLNTDYVTTPDQNGLVRGAIDGMTGALNDPYTEYYDPQQYQQLINELNGQFYGVGIEINQIGQYIVVQSVLPNSPALAAGLLAGDRITAVGTTSLLGVSPDTAATDIRGPQGTVATLTVLRGTKTLTFKITRGPISLPTVEDKMLPGNIAYIQLNQVSQDAGPLFQVALQKLSQNHPKGWILDLRNDPGGLVDQAVQILQNMIPSGTVVTFKGRIDNQVYTSNSGQKLKQPMVILVNGGTASAAEIITGALQDDGLATVIGTQTFGKGIAQEIIPMQNGGVLKVTVAKWYTPKGRNIELTGLAPDLFVDGTDQPLAMAERLLGAQMTVTSKITTGSIQATVDGQTVILDTPPALLNGNLFLSLEGASQIFGVNAIPNQQGNQVTLKYGKHTLVLTDGSTTGTMDGQSITVSPPYLSNGLLMVPVRQLLSLTQTAGTYSQGTWTIVNSTGTGQ